jgi:hypothetical protein
MRHYPVVFMSSGNFNASFTYKYYAEKGEDNNEREFHVH